MNQTKPSFGQAFKSFLMWFCFFYLVFWGITQLTTSSEKTAESPVIIKLKDASLSTGNLASFTIKNGSPQPLSFTSPCAGGESGGVGVYGLVGTVETDNLLSLDGCTKLALPSFEIAPGESHTFDLRYFSTETFKSAGNYVLKLKVLQNGDPLEIVSPQFSYSEPGIFRKLFRAIVSKPLFNLLVFFIKILPTHSLGLSIIFLTLVVRAILFIPNQKAMRSQYEMQKVQPKITELREKYKNNPQVMAMKTMELYKVHKINPMGSLLPVLAQFPFLIGTYLIISDGVSPHLEYLFYSFNSMDLTIVNNLFLWLNLQKPDPYYILPVVVGVIQFITMKLSFARAKAKKKGPKNVPNEDMAQSMQKTMTYVMPIMIGVFTAIFPSGIGIYWFTSTLFGAVQQKLVQASVEKPELNVVKRIES
ncbi:MAG TPA: YidC/Oxa1 family membrane protein insertase [Candidatus Gracilibacteria bacterium]